MDNFEEHVQAELNRIGEDRRPRKDGKPVREPLEAIRPRHRKIQSKRFGQ